MDYVLEAGVLILIATSYLKVGLHFRENCFHQFVLTLIIVIVVIHFVFSFTFQTFFYHYSLLSYRFIHFLIVFKGLNIYLTAFHFIYCMVFHFVNIQIEVDKMRLLLETTGYHESNN